MLMKSIIVLVFISVTSQWGISGQLIGFQDGAHLTMTSPFFVVNKNTFSLDDDSLKKIGSSQYNGVDSSGSFAATVEKFVAEETRFQTTLRNYSSLGVVTFQVSFLDDVSVGSFDSSSEVSCGYPCFEIPETSELGFLSFGGNMFGNQGKKFGRWQQSAKFNYGMSGGPLSLFDHNATTALVWSAMNEFMITSIWLNETKSRVCHGVIATVPTIPQGYKYSSIVATSTEGINQAFFKWGNTLRRFYNRDTFYRDTDLVLNYLGYWTDGGAYYFYNTEPNMTYEDTIKKVKDEAQKQAIPYRYMQLDSWWYFKDRTEYQDVTRWESMPSVFPDGMRAIWDYVEMPLACHNRQWSHLTPYAKENGGQFNFVVEHDRNISVPQDPKFWQYLFSEAKHWGLTMYEQDHMDQQTTESALLQSSLTAGRDWLMQMGQAARDQGLTLQYCMSYPRHALQSLEIPVVTHARVSGDYRGGSDQWKMGVSSIFAYALGIAPFHDCFWSTDVYQPGNTYNLSEPHPELMVAVATLSTGPVAPADKVGYTNRTTLMRCCTEGGLILKASAPALAIDDQILQAAFNDTSGPNGEVWTTYSRIGEWSFGIVLAADLKKDYSLTPNKAGFRDSSFGDHMKVFSASAWGDLSDFSESTPLQLKTSNCQLRPFCLYYTAPVMMFRGSEVVILGELGSKVVPFSPQRIQYISIDEGQDVTVGILGALGEKIEFAIALEGSWFRYACMMNGAGKATLHLVGDSEIGRVTQRSKRASLRKPLASQISQNSVGDWSVSSDLFVDDVLRDSRDEMHTGSSIHWDTPSETDTGTKKEGDYLSKGMNKECALIKSSDYTPKADKLAARLIDNWGSNELGNDVNDFDTIPEETLFSEQIKDDEPVKEISNNDDIAEETQWRDVVLKYASKTRPEKYNHVMKTIDQSKQRIRL